MSGRCKIICEATPCNNSLLPHLCHSVLFHFWLVLSISGACSLLDCQSYKELLCGKKRDLITIKKCPQKFLHLKSKSILKRQQQPILCLLSLSENPIPGVCCEQVLLVLIQAQSESEICQDKFPRQNLKCQQGSADTGRSCPSLESHSGRAESKSHFSSFQTSEGFVLRFCWVFFKLSVCHRLAKAECVPLWRQSLLETGCHQQSV